MRRSCRRLAPDLVDHAAGALPARRRGALAAHLRRCSACRKDLRALRSLPGLLPSQTETDLSEAAWEQQRAAIMRSVRRAADERAASGGAVRSWWADPRLAVAGILPVLIAVAGVLWLGGELRRVEELTAAQSLTAEDLIVLAEVSGAEDVLVQVAAAAADRGSGLAEDPWLDFLESAPPAEVDELSDGELRVLQELVGYSGNA